MVYDLVTYSTFFFFFFHINLKVTMFMRLKSEIMKHFLALLGMITWNSQLYIEVEYESIFPSFNPLYGPFPFLILFVLIQHSKSHSFRQLRFLSFFFFKGWNWFWLQWVSGIFNDQGKNEETT